MFLPVVFELETSRKSVGAAKFHTCEVERDRWKNRNGLKKAEVMLAMGVSMQSTAEDG
jgi:hypothetical protein